MTELFREHNEILALADEKRRAALLASCDQQLAAAEAAVQAGQDLLAGLDTEVPVPPRSNGVRKNRNLSPATSSTRFGSGSGDEDGGAPRPQKNHNAPATQTNRGVPQSTPKSIRPFRN